MPARIEVEGFPSTKHPLWTLWGAMHQRCTNPKRKYFHRYGARGISVYKPWADFSQFVADINEYCGHRPTADHTLDRIDNDGNYEPGNVRWADPFEQAENTERTTLVEYKGELISRPEAARRAGISHATLRRRMRDWAQPLWFKPAGFRTISTSEASARAARSRQRKGNVLMVKIDGLEMPVSQAAKMHGISNGTVHSRIKSGWPESRWFEPVK